MTRLEFLGLSFMFLGTILLGSCRLPPTSPLDPYLGSTGPDMPYFSPVIPRGRALFLWDTSTPAPAIVSFAAARGISTIFLDANYLLKNDQNSLASYLQVFHKAGLVVHYLDGDPAWATTAKSTALTRLKAALAFYINGEAFDGIQFDVEPYLLPGWQSSSWSTSSIWSNYLGLLKQCMNLMSTNGRGRPFGAAIPFWYDTSAGGSLACLQAVQSLVNYVAVMDYRTNASSLISCCQNELAGGQTVICVETSSNVTPDQSFWYHGNAYMESQLSQISNNYWGLNNCRGIAIHQYYYYRNLKP